jgi:hypothetical protein
MAVIIFIPNVCAIKMSVSSGNGVSYSGNYRMATSASLQDNVLLNGEGIFQDTKASGTGKNAIIQSIGGRGYNGESSLVTSGSFRASSSSIATSDSGISSHDVSVNGNGVIGASADSTTSTAVQQASVDNGFLTSSQNLAMGASAIAGQKTSIRGDDGSIDSLAQSQSNTMSVSGGFSGENGNLDAQLVSVADKNAEIYGASSIEDVDCYSGGQAQKAAGGTYIEGFYPVTSGGYGSFNLLASNSIVNTKSKMPASSSTKSVSAIKPLSSGAHPEILRSSPGKSDSYIISRKNGIDPANPLQIYLKNDAIFDAEGLKSNAVNQALVLATGTWDYWTKPTQNNLFEPTVINDPSKAADTQDGYSVHAFKNLGSNCLAYANTYLNDKNYIVESDVSYNTNAYWTTDWNTAVRGRGIYVDFQTIALHELGHSVGLGDLYILPRSDARTKDLSAIMNCYATPRHTLGKGDIKGVQTIYGA